jgi:hypothetical protein
VLSVSGVGKDTNAIADLLDALDLLVETEAVQKAKLVELLLFSCYAARLLHGARTTSCKDANDLTAAFHTLEVARLAERAGLLDETREGAVLDRLRGMDGVRLRYCVLNTGHSKYSYSALQRRALPPELRLPAAAGGIESEN